MDPIPHIKSATSPVNLCTMAFSIRYTTIVFDLGDVLFSWSPKTKTTISPISFMKILSSSTWSEYECGRLSENDCYERIANQFSFEPCEVTNAFAQARDSVQSNDDLISVIQELKVESDGTLQVYAMSNISIPDYEVLRAKSADWSIFDQIFTSGVVGERKPNLDFFRHVLDSTHTVPESAIFVDDKLENVLSAQSLGLYGIVFHDTAQVAQTLRNLIGDPVKREQAFLLI
jgi:FMN phosphatase YigB (HAD superfamily)